MSKNGRKVLVLGVDGLDPRLTKKYIDQGKMPHLKQIIDRGAQREDLVMLGAMPTVTPPMWTTLATGAYPNTHGITDFYLQSETDLDAMCYGLDSRSCKAEQIWNVTAESGVKTLVFHWPGSSWPPSSDSPNLHVVDGSSPGSVGMSKAQVEGEFIVGASVNYDQPRYVEKGIENTNSVCIITDLEVEEYTGFGKDLRKLLASKNIRKICLKESDGQMGVGKAASDGALCPIKEPNNWSFEVPEKAKEVTLILSKGLVRRPALILANKKGEYDRVAVYKSKKDIEPLYVLPKGELVTQIIDEAIRDDERYTVNRNMRVLDIGEDGTTMRMWISAAMDITCDVMYHPHTLYKQISENVGFPPPTSLVGAANRDLIIDCMGANWRSNAEWQGKTLNYLIDNNGYEAVFSHFHNVDLQSHILMRHLLTGYKNTTPQDIQEALDGVYEQVDHYMSYFLHYLDEGWTLIVTSDHGLVSSYNPPHFLGDMQVTNVRVLEELGYTVLKKDAEGNELPEIDWEKTRAVANRAMDIWINLKGRDAHGIVDPEDKYELEEQIITDLYGYKDKKTGKRVVGLALHNKDAAVLGMGGPGYGDIIYITAEGYNLDHGDSLSTYYGNCDTSVSPIFIAAGQGLKQGFTTTRVIREVDVAPTVAVLLGLRMPAQCEGAPVYQILEDEYRG